MSYYAALTLPQATTVEDWVQKMTALADADIAAGKLAKDRRLTILATGAPQQLLPGVVKK
jgi:hypothetical protein